MSDFRYYAIDDWGAIFDADYLEVTDLQAAIAHCHNMVRHEKWGRVKRLEIWERDALLYQISDVAIQIHNPNGGD